MSNLTLREQPITHVDWQKRLDETLSTNEPYLGHELRPIPLRKSPPKTEKIATYVELDLYKFFEEYAVRMGARSISEVVRRLSIIGALAEGYKFDEEKPS